MRWRPLLWLFVSLLCFLGAVYFWRLGDQWAAEKNPAPAAPATNQNAPISPPAPKPVTQSVSAPIRLLSDAGHVNSWPTGVKTNRVSRLNYRLSNTTNSVGKLARNDRAILLENALFDTTQPGALAIPDHLRAQGDPGSYIVQSHSPLDNAFRAQLREAGATIVAYIPNNAYLVRASAVVAQQLQGSAQSPTVLPYEPYYKLKPIEWAVEQKPLPENIQLNVLLFADARQTTLEQLGKLGAEVLSEERSPFGPVFRIRPQSDSLSAIAGLSGVQEVEFAHPRILANDLSRVTVGVAPDTQTPTNYLDLTGQSVLVNINDTGVDSFHPDLANRVSGAAVIDIDGHGTHIAGIIAGDGTQSSTVTNAVGSINPGTNGQYRGKAPKATLFSMDYHQPDYFLQEAAARTNALISNNSWTYGVAEYDLAAASYDAAVRDAVPEISGAQPLALIFPAGNGGGVNILDTGANDGGSGGNPDTIQSPGTAKNVITVGAVEQFRNITNETVDCSSGTCITNQPWLPSTDSSNQIAGFSSRGNVGIQLEGDFGRFKPDVVAPGTFVVSTRSGQWDTGAYYSSIDSSVETLRSQLVAADSTYNSIIFVPDNTIQLTVTAFPAKPVPLTVSLTSPTARTVTGVNQATAVPAGAELGDYWTYTISNGTAQDITFDLQTLLVTTNSNGDFMDVLRTNLNDALGPYYRYESGTSLAAADASGTLALIEEFFTQRARMKISPALLKALLINGARPLGSGYDLQVKTPINYQGWGEIFLPTSLPGVLSNATSQAAGVASSMFIFDQSPTNALASGQSHTRFFSLSPEGQNQELRVTLVWTDPPGDPAASIKLVNDLDLVVTNLDTGDVFFGNDIAAGREVNVAWPTNTVPNVDTVNNVENVYLKEQPGSNYSVTVIGHRVNVNAVPASIDVAQDYALVVSSGDGFFPDALTLSRDPGKTATINAPNVFYVTNNLPTDPENPVSGGMVLHQHVGANTPLLGTNTVPLPTDANAVITLGMTNQWHFYMLSNDMNFTNASFVTFLPPDLAVPRMGVTNVDNPANATRLEADIDMYVSTNPGLTNLSPAAIAAADKSVGRGGTEFIVESNAQPGAVYYVGIKSEDQQAAEYGFLGVFSLFPPSSSDTNGNVFMRGMPVPAVIPPGTPPHPQAALVIGIDTRPIHIQRVIVTNTITHNLPGSLLGTLSHNTKFAVLNNHTCATDPASGNCITNIHDYIYEDNGQHDIAFSRPSDGPGSLKDFVSEEGLGVWLLTEVSNFQSTTGVVNRLLIKLEPQNLSSNAVVRLVLPNTFSYDSIDVPADATNLTVCVSGNTAPIELYVKRGSLPTQTDFDYHKTIINPGSCLPITVFDQPPLVAGTYYIGVYNNSGVPQDIRITATVFKNPFAIASSLANAIGPVPIVDDAVSYAYITNLNHLTVSGLDVGLLISDPRISDLAISLISPNGTRVLLFENRGGLSTTGLGTFSTATNDLGLPIFATTNMTPFYTNNFDDVVTGVYTPGATFDGWNVLSNFAVVYPELPAPWLSNNVAILGQSSISNNLPTTNSVDYRLSFEVSHAPYLVGTVGWWPLDGDAQDIFSGLNGLLFGDVSFRSFPGKVNEALFGDGAATRMVIPSAPQLDVGGGQGFTLEGWIYPTNGVVSGTNGSGIVMTNGFEGIPPAIGLPAGTYVSGWLVVTGDVDVLTSRSPQNVPCDSGVNCLELNGYVTGAISTNFNTIPGQSYRLSFAYTKNPYTPNPAGFVANMDISLTGQPDWLVSYSTPNSRSNPNWLHTSEVFTASSPVTTLTVTSLNAGNFAMLVDSFEVVQVEAGGAPATAPLVEWSDADWIYLTNRVSSTTNYVIAMTNGFEGIPPITGLTVGSYVDGWLVVTGYVDVLTAQSPQRVPVDSGVNCLELLGSVTGAISTNFNTIPGKTYQLSFAYRKNPYLPNPPGTAILDLALTGQPDWIVGYTSGNTYTRTSLVFTASSPVTTLTVTSLNAGQYGMLVDSFQVAQVIPPNASSGQGVQLWVSGLPGTNVPGALSVNLWDIASQPHVLSTAPDLITNGGWQHVALTYDAASFTARLYVNGAPAATQTLLAPGLFPLTSGNLYFGFHPVPAPNFAAFGGGLDEVGLYDRALSDCEVAAIFKAGSNGKYDPVVLSCPVTNTVQIVTSLGGLSSYTFVNGLSWTKGPRWETNTITFANSLGDPAANVTPIVVTSRDPNTTVDNFVLSAVLTNYVNGLLHFTEDTNLAVVPIKFAPSPYTLSNFPPTLVFSNGFEKALPGPYTVGATLPGSANNFATGPRNWTVTNGSVTVISNILVDAAATNCVALGGGALQCNLPTVPGGRYRLTYSVRGPGAVSWWSGDVEPLSHRAWDLLGGNNGAFLNGATNLPNGEVNVNGDANALFFPGVIDPTNNLASKIELGDPANLRLTNGITIEGWINPNTVSSFAPEQVEQLLFRGDSRACHDPYWFGLERVSSSQLDLVFHIENENNFDCGVILETANQPVHAGQWQHVAAVFEPNVLWTPNATYFTNELRLYVNGQQLTPQNGDVFLEDPANATFLPSEFTGRFPFANLDPAFSPGVAIGNTSRADNSEPYHGYIDELTIYGRALTGPEIAAIANSGASGKADLSVPPNLSLGKVGVFLDDIQLDVGYGDNASWTTHSVEFTADRTNIVLTLQGELPGTLVDGVSLTDLPAELNYLPEESLAALNGEDAYGVWKLEMWDTRTGTSVAGFLQDWQLNFILVPSNAPPVVQLVHGIPYTNTIAAHGIQNFVVDVPLWATNATNVLLSAANFNSGAPSTAGVLWSLSQRSPSSTANALFWPAVTSGTNVLSTNPVAPYIVPGQPYFLTVTNPNPVPITFAYGVWFDIQSLTNCRPASNFVWQAGVPRYFQFDVPPDAVAPGAPPQAVSFYLTGVSGNFTGIRSNLTVVLSETLPLPDLSHYDYISSQPDTNDNIIMVVTNTTPFPIQTNRWYVGVFSSASTMVPFSVAACINSAYPVIIPLANDVPFVAATTNSPFIAPPGPPRNFFFQFQITNAVDAVLFEMYNLSGDADLVLQRDVPPTMAPYFDGSFEAGVQPEQIVLRRTFDVPDLRGNWYLGIYNNLTTNVAYTLRASLQTNGLLLSALPLQFTLTPLAPPRGSLLQWNSIEGEYYIVENSLDSVNWTPVAPAIRATTPLTTMEVFGAGSFRVRQIPPSSIPTTQLYIQLWTNGLVRISWSTNFPNLTLQFALSALGPWTDLGLPVVVEGNRFVVYDPIGVLPRFYRLRP